MLNGAWGPDFIDQFLQLTEGEFTSEIHRKWAGISCVAGALERRVWVRTGSRINYPNLYVLLVAPPGRGKYIIELVRQLWTETRRGDSPAFHVAPDSATRAALIDDLARAKQTHLPPSGPIYTYHSLLIPSEEFEVILPSYEPELISMLNSIWNNKPLHHERRRHGPARDVMITNPMFNILGGATPAYFTAHFPDEAWNTGLIRRTILVFSAESPLKSLLYENPSLPALRLQLLHKIGIMAALYGEAQWESTDAVKYLDDWHLAGGPPSPTHSKLANYRQTRSQFILRLALISGVSRTGHPIISMYDLRRAFDWLFEAEALMPDIFRAMVGKSDAQIIEELHNYLWASWIKRGKNPLPGEVLKTFLGTRVPSEKVDPVIRLALGMNVIGNVAGTTDLFLPRPKHLHGVE